MWRAGFVGMSEYYNIKVPYINVLILEAVWNAYRHSGITTIIVICIDFI